MTQGVLFIHQNGQIRSISQRCSAAAAAAHLRGAGEGSGVTGQTLAAGLQPATLVGLLGAGGAGGQAGGAPHPEEEEEVTIHSRFKIQDSRCTIMQQ